MLLLEERDPVTYLHRDHMGSIVAASDSEGAGIGRRGYDVTGQLRSAEGFVDPYGFTGQEHEATGFVRFLARHLDPYAGRWTTPDPLFNVVRDVSVGRASETTNVYGYVGNNFANMVDPPGLRAKRTIRQSFGRGADRFAFRIATRRRFAPARALARLLAPRRFMRAAIRGAGFETTARTDVRDVEGHHTKPIEAEITRPRLIDGESRETPFYRPAKGNKMTVETIADRVPTSGVFTTLCPQPQDDALPAVVPSPFAVDPPHPLVAQAVAETCAFLEGHPELPLRLFQSSVGGKMFGVAVVVLPDGTVGYLRGFAGALDGRWALDGFVPPVFDAEAFDDIWQRAKPEIWQLDSQINALRQTSPDSQRLAEIRAEQKRLSRATQDALHALYVVRSFDGASSPLRGLFEPHLPPGGAGDCAAPKLLAHAYRINARPVALGEFWWGDPPRAGGRQHGVMYPACRGRCGTILPFMLRGLAHEPEPDVGMLPVDSDEPRVVFEDDWLVVVDKPAGLLSVPGRGPSRRDSVAYRLQQRTEGVEPGWPRVAHRLDLSTSGLLLAAKDADTHRDLQALFRNRTVHKRYIAEVEGTVASDDGEITLPIGFNYADRPRKMVDHEGGKPSVTRWRVLSRTRDATKTRTRLALYPVTGRSHQLRIHASHPDGLGCPIVGDLLYGFGGERMHLHAETLGFTHPATEEDVSLHSEPPF